MPIGNIGKKKPNRDENYRPSYNNINPRIPGIAAFLNAYRREQHTNRQQEHREYRGHRFREWLTIIFLIATTAGVFIQAAILNSTDSAMHESAKATINAAKAAKESADAAKNSNIYANRSWIAPLGIDATGEIAEGKDLPFSIYYANVGKSPAIMADKWEVVAGPYDQQKPTAPIFAGPNLNCEGLMVPEIGSIIFPDDNKDHWIISFIEGKNISSKVMSGEHFLIIRGCLRYRTLEELHSTAICYVLKKGNYVSTRNNTISCGDGNFAN